MPHMFRQGFSVRQPAWHGLATVVDQYPGRAEAERLAGHDHQIVDAPVFVGEWVERDSGLAICRPGTAHTSRYTARLRADTGQLVAILPASRPIVQNDVPWNMIEQILELPNVEWETGGVLDGVIDPETGELKSGAVYWVLARLDQPYRIAGDPSEFLTYVLGTWSHDGTQSLRIKETDVRVICANTQNSALRGAGRDYIDLSYRHTVHVADRIAQARLTLDHVQASNRAFVEAAEALARQAIREDGLRAFVETVVPMPVTRAGLQVTDRVVHNIERTRESLWGILNGQTCEGIRNTAWGLVQGGIELFDHERPHRSARSYFKRNLMNESAQKQGLLEVVREIAAEYAV
jgi:phage/plasmid-like protein (TIGR03299 family)